MSACVELEPLLMERASGPLDPEDEARVQAHLGGCAGCQQAFREALSLFGAAALPPPSANEQAVLHDLPQRTREALRRAEWRSRWLRRSSAAMLAAAAAILVALAPGGSRRGAQHPANAVLSQQTGGESDLESWAMSDPLGDALSDGSDEEAALAGDDETSIDASATPEDEPAELYLDPGDGT